MGVGTEVSSGDEASAWPAASPVAPPLVRVRAKACAGASKEWTSQDATPTKKCSLIGPTERHFGAAVARVIVRSHVPETPWLGRVGRSSCAWRPCHAHAPLGWRRVD